jgi:hypothetical protein
MLTTNNCYVTVSGADVYFEDQLHREAWDTFQFKDKALISATSLLDSSCLFPGYKSSADQPLEWPRKDVFCGNDYVDSATIPYPVEVATYEVAFSIMDNDPTEANKMAGYKQVEVGSLNVVADESTRQRSPINDYVYGILGCLASNPTGGLTPIFRQ